MKSVSKRSRIERKIELNSPDKGWAWIVVVAAFFMSALTLGASRSLGLVYMHIIDIYGVSREEASWPFSLYIAVFSLAGPLAGILSHHITIRSIACIGSALCAFGLIFSYFVKNIATLSITIGVIQGMGLGLTLVARSAIVNQYFKKHRVKANSISSAGGNIGGFAITLFLEYLLENYDLSNALLLLGGVSLNSFAMALLFRPPSWITLSTSSHGQKHVDPPNGLKVGNQQTSSNTDIEKGYHLVKQTDESSTDQDECRNATTKDRHCSNGLSKHSLPLVKDDTEVNEQLTSSLLKSAENSQTCEHEIPNKSDEKSREKQHTFSALIVEKFSQTWSLISVTCMDPMFIIICLTHALYRWILLAYTMFIVDLATDKGSLRHEAVRLLPLFSVAELTGRLGCGWLADKHVLTRKNLIILVFIIMSACLHVTPLVQNYAFLVTTCVGVALTSGVMSVLPTVLFVEYLGLEKMPLAFGLATCSAGLLSLTRPPLVGFFRDKIGTYDGLLHLQGFVALGLAGCWLFEPLIMRRIKK